MKTARLLRLAVEHSASDVLVRSAATRMPRLAGQSAYRLEPR